MVALVVDDMVVVNAAVGVGTCAAVVDKSKDGKRVSSSQLGRLLKYSDAWPPPHISSPLL